MTSNNSTPDKNDPKYWCQWTSGDEYFGASKVVDDELVYIKARRADASKDNLTGLALSGGGIRSATFSLGVMQALAHKDWLKKFDYLSTVSGGGYIGSSLTWLLHKEWSYKDNDNLPKTITFGLNETDFPYKTTPVWSDGITEPDDKNKTVKGSVLRWLRQHAKYLTPGGDHTFLTLIAVVIRSSILNLLFYLAMLTLLFIGFNELGVLNKINLFFGHSDINAPALLVFSAWLVGLFVVLSLVYAIMTSSMKTRSATSDNENTCKRYARRRFTEKYLKYLMTVILILSAFGIIPLVPEWIEYLLSEENKVNKDFIANIVAIASSISGLLTSAGVFAQSKSKETPKSMDTLVILASALLLFGFLLLGHQLATQTLPELLGNWMYAPLLGLISIAFIANINYISVHRFYRDRLMETFMPDVANAIRTKDNEAAASPEADSKHIQDIYCDSSANLGPYHLINTNIVLVNSKRPKFKGRGGDNFILSPFYCGSNATGWQGSSKFMSGRMTLATAMAISGAAVNPKTGCGGEGVTRNQLLSTLMGLLNIRLGYWTHNPDLNKASCLSHPNVIWPGLGDILLNKNLDENSSFIQLSDGGHFENLAVYELIRRKLKVIVVCDGGADPDYTFTDLANAIEKARADFGALIKVDGENLYDLIPRKTDTSPSKCKFAKKGYLIADIHYPGDAHGTLIYLTTTFTEGLSADLYGYRKEHPEFPDEPTSDQFFDEKQFEAYRELGFQLAWKMLQDPKIKSDMSMIISEPS